MKYLRRPNGFGDTGTFTPNAVKSGDTNALADVEDEYERVKEFFKIENEALIVSAYLTMYDDRVPEDIQSAPPQLQRQWLHDRVNNVLNATIMPDIEKLGDMRRASPEGGLLIRGTGRCL